MNKNYSFLKLGSILFFSLILVLTFSQVVAANVQIRAGRLDYQADWIDLEDGVTIFWEEYEIVSDRGEIDRPESITYLYDNVEVTFERGFINSDNLVIYMNDDELVFTDNVFLNYRRGQAENDEDEGEGEERLELSSERLVYNTEAGTFDFEDNIEIRQAGRTIRAGEGTYNEAEDIFYFRSGVEIVEDDGDRITSETARLDLSEGDLFTAEGNVEIELQM